MSASYMPHSWRSGLIRAHIDHPVVRFGDLVLDETASVRAALSERINDEFGAAALTTEFPLIASYVISQCSTRGSLLTAAVEIRRTAKATAFRNWLYDIEANSAIRTTSAPSERGCTPSSASSNGTSVSPVASGRR